MESVSGESDSRKAAKHVLSTVEGVAKVKIQKFAIRFSKLATALHAWCSLRQSPICLLVTDN